MGSPPGVASLKAAFRWLGLGRVSPLGVELRWSEHGGCVEVRCRACTAERNVKIALRRDWRMQIGKARPTNQRSRCPRPPRTADQAANLNSSQEAATHLGKHPETPAPGRGDLTLRRPKSAQPGSCHLLMGVALGGALARGSPLRGSAERYPERGNGHFLPIFGACDALTAPALGPVLPGLADDMFAVCGRPSPVCRPSPPGCRENERRYQAANLGPRTPRRTAAPADSPAPRAP